MSGKSVLFISIMHSFTIRQVSDYATAITLKGGEHSEQGTEE